MSSWCKTAQEAGLQSQQRLRKTAHHRSETFTPFSLADTELTVPARFAKQVAVGPSRLAVKTATDQLTYQELNEMAIRVAWSVLESSNPSIVPIVLEQGIRATVAIFGVLKAGRTYLHLDPAVLSSSILERVLERFRMSTIISDKATASGMLLEGPWIDFDEFDSGRVDEPDVEMSADDVAQFLLTSGSTGDPKIICHTHRTLLTSARSTTNHFHVCPDDRLTLFASGTGQANGVLFSSLLNGASAHHLNVRKESFLQVAERILSDAITIYFSSVTLFRHFLKTVGATQVFPDVRLVRLGSEPAYSTDCDLWKRHFTDDCMLMNGLATSEAGAALEYYVDKRAERESGYLPVGRPVDGVNVTIVNDEGQPLGVNEIGEITIESGAVALGYWERPDLTAAVFGNGKTSRRRLFRTNDLGRMRVDGSIEHLGRKDFRVKVHGYWVDLGEVERALMDLPCVQAAAVMLRHDEEHERLVAYVVPSNDARLVVGDLRRQLDSVLGNHMQPAFYVVMERFPTNAAGKIDRNSLPPPDLDRPSQAMPSLEPRTDTERSISRIWSEVLGLDPLGIRERLLDLGGDSLLAAQIVARVHAAHGVEVPVFVLLQSATIEEMALTVDKHQLVRAAQSDPLKLVSTIEDMPDDEVKRLLSSMDLRERIFHP